MGQPEYDEVELPLIRQLEAMGWTHLQGAPPGHHPTDSLRSTREDFRTVVLEDRFRRAVREINPGPAGGPWLDERRLDSIVDKVLRQSPLGVPGNLLITSLLRTGVTVEGLPDWDDHVNQDICLINFDEPDKNDLLAVSQFRIDRPDHAPAVPDIVLFVNGLPLVIIECKRPGPRALDDAVDQLLRYAGAHEPAAVPELVRLAQLLIATDREGAQLATVTAKPRHFAAWRTVEPASADNVREELGGKPDTQKLLPQEILVAGTLRPAHLLSLVRDFMVTGGGSGRTSVKIIARWQQFRAVHRLTARLKARKASVSSSGAADHRAGVVWHTQGSGKSLTMAFLVRALRTDRNLTGYKVVVVTDRLDLQDQIGGSLGASDEKVHMSSGIEEAHDDLARRSPDLVMVMIQKAQQDEDADDGTEEKLGATPEETHVHALELNDSPSIVVLVDEAHRSQDSWLHARLRAMLPNAAMLGFTGTPIVRGQGGRKKRTDEIFGDIVDAYTLHEAIEDKAVVPVLYEGRLPRLDVIEKAALDAGFEQAVGGTPEQRARVIQQLGRRKEVLEAQSVIEAKARDIFDHWVRTAMPDGFGAQIVAVSRKAAVCYRTAILKARDELLQRLDAVSSVTSQDPMAYERADEEERELLDLLRYRNTLATVDAAVVISASAGGKDPKEWKRWTLLGAQKTYIRRFREGIDALAAAVTDPSWTAHTHGGGGIGIGLGGAFSSNGDPWEIEEPEDGNGAGGAKASKDEEGPLAFLLVKSKLLTGFDAPVEQVLYLDRTMKGVELLQAMARTNRPYGVKDHGLVVDYVGVFSALRKALGEYDAEHLRQVVGGDRSPEQTLMQPFDESALPHLRSQRRRVEELLHRLDITNLVTLSQREDLLAALHDPDLRADFDERVRDFLGALNAVLPRPQALEHRRLAQQLGEVQYLTRRRYRDGRDEFSPRRYGAKVRILIDRHIEVEAIEQRTPPIDLTAEGYLEKVAELVDDRARALEMSSALKERIDVRLPSAPDRRRYEMFSERLEEVTRRMREDFEAAARDLLELVAEEREATRQETAAGLDHFTVQPVRSLLEAMLQEAGLEAGSLAVDLDQAANDIVVHLASAVRPPHFAENPDVQRRARRRLLRYLEDDLQLVDADPVYLATQLVDLAARRVEDFRRWSAANS
ncbi:HsdR family type I site-specific deoxyribonuclease [Streptosporangium subroseum]|uniref:type I restriction endonuclease subunit R n=1 Tax=Streptosporangium subroseum TaxID=106412 RepID=UPI0034484813